ncbi:MAG: peptidoglycan DD-metalloendopeptidase family protein [Ignavibacteriales bacterium]|nr:peptidoglycan DD-metalloendopeptidase family protein [Ignavibacteriales bacterium]
MKNLLLTLSLALLASTLFAQTEKAVYKSVADKLEYFYNTEKYDSVFALFSSEMQNFLPLNKTIDFLTGLKSQAGKITKRQFVKYVNGTYASYKTNFERALYAVNISVDNNSKINGLFVKPFTEDNLPKIDRNSTKLTLPFKGEWTVIWGGDTKELNYHIESPAQKNAFDFVITDIKGNSFKTDGKTNEDYYAFGKELIAPCDGEIVLVVDGVKDNIPGNLNPVYLPGNTVIIKTMNNEYLFFAHFKQHSIKVTEGQKVKQGMVLGLCGNSGNSSEPHLHFHIQNVEDMNVATGVKCFFDKLIVNGQTKTDYSPIKKDKIKSE